MQHFEYAATFKGMIRYSLPLPLLNVLDDLFQCRPLNAQCVYVYVYVLVERTSFSCFTNEMICVFGQSLNDAQANNINDAIDFVVWTFGIKDWNSNGLGSRKFKHVRYHIWINFNYINGEEYLLEKKIGDYVSEYVSMIGAGV